MGRLNFKKLINDGRIKKLIIVSGAVGIALIFLSSFIELPQGDSSVDVEGYKAQMQSSIAATLDSVEGVGENRVLLTIENSVEGVYLNNSSTKTKEIEPKIRGVVVVCEGGDDPVVVDRVNEIVTKALNISAAKVCVTRLKDE